MYDDQLHTLLRQPIIARFTTIRPDGYPHTVPVWFMLDGDDLLLFTLRDARKVKNALAHPKGCFSLGGDPAGSPGYLIDGDLVVEDDPEHLMAARITNHYESPEKAAEDLAAWQDENFVVLRLKPRRVVQVS
ncbi:MAG: pyridoxamine 5'-phosphate oxidase family protein [Ardenticatenaceae bacterium]|nr:pyridoxamine 5'-phosphate oxidase family protein [Ardenticatenaceae bacterium]